jgi:hypothetical protein
VENPAQTAAGDLNRAKSPQFYYRSYCRVEIPPPGLQRFATGSISSELGRGRERGSGRVTPFGELAGGTPEA